MRTRRCEMGVESRLRYYEAFISVRDIMRVVETTCEVRSESLETPRDERSAFRVEQLRWQCALAAIESKRQGYDSNKDAVYAPWTRDLHAITSLAAEARALSANRTSIADLRQIATESAQFFAHLHP